MKIALYTSESEEHVAFVRSLGLTDVVCGLPADFDGVVPVEAFERRRDLFSRHELDWGVIENLTSTLYDEIMFGTPERERQLDGAGRVPRVPHRDDLPRAEGVGRAEPLVNGEFGSATAK